MHRLPLPTAATELGDDSTSIAATATLSVSGAGVATNAAGVLNTVAPVPTAQQQYMLRNTRG
jgi:hypothetical protein